MKKFLGMYKYTAILMLCQLCGMLMIHYEADLIRYFIAGSTEGILGSLIYHKKI